MLQAGSRPCSDNFPSVYGTVNDSMINLIQNGHGMIWINMLETTVMDMNDIMFYSFLTRRSILCQFSIKMSNKLVHCQVH